jgi:pimeloyl-ACP methyl ester carboxylesterase
MTNDYAPASRRIIAETRLIPTDTAGVQLQLINKCPDDLRHFSPKRTLMMMHGATFSAASLFDVAVDGVSFMDVLAGSTRPPEMSRPPEGAAPLTPARIAVADLSAGIDFVRRHRSVERLGLLGMSWGATVAGVLASELSEQIEKLVLVTPLWLSGTPLRIDPGGPLGAYRVVDPKAYGAAWRAAAPEHARQALIPEEWFEAWVEATLATDPDSPVAGTVRAPSGAVRDVRDHWTVGEPLYDPAAIACPVLVVCAEWDVDVRFDMAHDLFVRLTGAPYKRFVEIGRGTHMILMERNRKQAFDAVVAFLDEHSAPAA